ncbi:MAG: ROK family protein [Spirochaetales bacterium]|nr:ROK family protein [Spirochaetales bacterium]
MSRAELARKSNLRQATITNISKELISLGYIRETGYLEGKGGRRSVGLAIDETRFRTISARLTRHHFTVGLFTVLGTELTEKRETVDVATGPEVALDKMAEVVNDLTKHVGRENVLGMGLAVPGPFIQKKAHIALITRFPGWEHVRLREELEKRINIPLVLEHDANAAVLAEWWIGKGSSGAYNSMVYYVGGQGIGAGIISNGRVLRGYLGTAGEIGHHSIRFDGPQCECGNKGCLELYGSTISITEAYRKEKGVAEGSELPITFDDVVQGFLENEDTAVNVVGNAAAYTATGLANVANILNPELIVIGDEITAFGKRFISMIQEKLRTMLIPELYESLDIPLSSFREDATVRGMAMIVAEDTLPLD